MGNQLRDSIKVFGDFFKIAGLDETKFMVPADGTWKEKADMQMRRLKVAQMVLNGDKSINKANTSQWKYTPFFRVIPDANALAGFRLAYSDDGHAHDSTFLGARPELVAWEDAVFIGKEFTTECELLVQYQAMAEAELMEELRNK